MKGRNKKILSGIIVSLLSVCLFFTFGFWIDIEVNKDSASANIYLAEDLPGVEGGEEGDDPGNTEGGDSGVDGAGDDEDEDSRDEGEGNDLGDTEDGDDEDEDDLDDESKEKVYHIITNSNKGGFFGELITGGTGDEGEEGSGDNGEENDPENTEIVFWETEGNHTGTEGESFSLSYITLPGYELEYIRVGNTKYYPDEYYESIYFDKNLTIHAHFKKIKEPMAADDENGEDEDGEISDAGPDEKTKDNGKENNNGKDNKKEKKPKKNK